MKFSRCSSSLAKLLKTFTTFYDILGCRSLSYPLNNKYSILLVLIYKLHLLHFSLSFRSMYSISSSSAVTITWSSTKYSVYSILSSIDMLHPDILNYRFLRLHWDIFMQFTLLIGSHFIYFTTISIGWYTYKNTAQALKFIMNNKSWICLSWYIENWAYF